MKEQLKKQEEEMKKCNAKYEEIVKEKRKEMKDMKSAFSDLNLKIK